MIWTLRPQLAGMVDRMIRGAYQQSVLPPDERLEAEQRSIVEVDHRLVVDAHLTPLDGAVQRVAGAQIVDRAVMRLGLEQLRAVAPQHDGG